jgi:hypothetical protein
MSRTWSRRSRWASTRSSSNSRSWEREVWRGTSMTLTATISAASAERAWALAAASRMRSPSVRGLATGTTTRYRSPPSRAAGVGRMASPTRLSVTAWSRA